MFDKFLSFKEFHSYFVQTINTFKKEYQMEVIKNEIYFLQKYEKIHLYIPKILQGKISRTHNKETNYQISFNEIIFL